MFVTQPNGELAIAVDPSSYSTSSINPMLNTDSDSDVVYMYTTPWTELVLVTHACVSIVCMAFIDYLYVLKWLISIMVTIYNREFPRCTSIALCASLCISIFVLNKPDNDVFVYLFYADATLVGLSILLCCSRVVRNQITSSS